MEAILEFEVTPEVANEILAAETELEDALHERKKFDLKYRQTVELLRLENDLTRAAVERLKLRVAKAYEAATGPLESGTTSILSPDKKTVLVIDPYNVPRTYKPSTEKAA